MGETRRKGRGYGIAARVQEGGPVTWETSYLHLETPARGKPDTNLLLGSGSSVTWGGAKKQTLVRW